MDLATRSLWLWLLFAAALSSCLGASNDPGLGARLRVDGAAFVPEKLPKESGGPSIASIHVPHNQILPGIRSERLTGALESTSTAVLVGLRGEPEHWVIPAGVPHIEEPKLPSYQATLSFARDVEVGEQLQLELAAVDARGRVGTKQYVELTAVAAEAGARLVVRLRWDHDADLDLHVVDPRGREVWAGDINSVKAPPPGSLPGDPNAFLLGGILDFDSNAGCVVDGRREENVVWTAAPPSGRYEVRVAVASMCEEQVAHYEVEAFLDGRSLEHGTGLGLPSDARTGVSRGSGSFVFTFRVP